MKTDIDFKNTKLYTKDKELVRKYAKLCGASEFKYVQGGSYIGAWCNRNNEVRLFSAVSVVDAGIGKGIVTINQEQVETEYAKRFDFGKPSINKIQPHPEGLEYNRVGDSEVLWSSGVCLYRRKGEFVEVILPGEDKLPALEDVLSKLRGLSA